VATPVIAVARTRKKSNTNTAPTSSSENVISPVHSSHSQRSRYGRWRCNWRVRTLYSTTTAINATIDAQTVGQNRSGKLNALNG
jgi:hypothetical protein